MGANIIKIDLPLPLSHKLILKKAGMQLNFKSESSQILGGYIKLQRTTSGHNSVPVINMLLGTEKLPKIELHCETLEKCSRMEKRGKSEKLYK